LKWQFRKIGSRDEAADGLIVVRVRSLLANAFKTLKREFEQMKYSGSAAASRLFGKLNIALAALEGHQQSDRISFCS